MTAFGVLSSAAVTFVIVRSGIFAWLRRGPKGWVDFISCPLCTGFWVGLGLALSRFAFLNDLGALSAKVWFWLLLELVGEGALVGAAALLYTSAIDWMDALERAAERRNPGLEQRAQTELFPEEPPPRPNDWKLPGSGGGQ